jgi:flagellar FliL protein
MAEEREDDENDAEAEAAKAVGAAKKKKVILLAVLGVVLLALAGGGTWFALKMLGGEKAETAEAPAEQAEGGEHAAEAPGGPKKTSIYEPLDPAFLANYLINGRQRYLQLSLSVMAREQAGIDGVRVHMPLIRNRIVMILSGESFEGLQSDEGRMQLQQKLLAAIQEILQKETGKPGIEQVFFTNFVMQ